MKTTPHIVWKGLTSSEAVEQRVHAALERIEKFYEGIIACRVVIEKPHRHHRTGGHFGVKVEVSVPGRVLAVTHDDGADAAAADAGAAVDGAFDTVRRQLDDLASVRRGR